MNLVIFLRDWYKKNILELQIKILMNMYVQKKDRNNTFSSKILINRRILIILNGLLKHVHRLRYRCNISNVYNPPLYVMQFYLYWIIPLIKYKLKRQFSEDLVWIFSYSVSKMEPNSSKKHDDETHTKCLNNDSLQIIQFFCKCRLWEDRMLTIVWSLPFK